MAGACVSDGKTLLVSDSQSELDAMQLRGRSWASSKIPRSMASLWFRIPFQMKNVAWSEGWKVNKNREWKILLWTFFWHSKQ